MGFILFLVAFILSMIAFLPAMLFAFFKNFYQISFLEGLRRINEHFLQIATSLDTLGNVICDDLFNAILIKSNGYKFGHRKETISSVLGKNQRDKTLSYLGLLLVLLLILITWSNHCIISIDENV